MKTVFPVKATVKFGCSDQYLKIHFDDVWLFEYGFSKVVLHLGLNSICNPTEKEWEKYHSFNRANSIGRWLSEHGYRCGDSLLFYLIEDSKGFAHLILMQ